MKNGLPALTDLTAKQSDLSSPCIGVCVMDKSRGLCQGCYRTIAEICAWSEATSAEKRTIWLAIEQRIAEAF